MSFEDQHAKVDRDPLVELRRRQELWAAAPGGRGQPLMACIVPLQTVLDACDELERLRVLARYIGKDQKAQAEEAIFQKRNTGKYPFED